MRLPSKRYRLFSKKTNLPHDRGLPIRPVITGWFAAFGRLADADRTSIGFDDGENKFAGATYDPFSQYRGAAVADFFGEMNLRPDVLHANYRIQRETFRELVRSSDARFLLQDANSGQAGFTVLRHPAAGKIHEALKQAGVLTDYRGDALRFGFAPYVTSRSMKQAVTHLEQVFRTLELLDNRRG